MVLWCSDCLNKYKNTDLRIHSLLGDCGKPGGFWITIMQSHNELFHLTILNACFAQLPKVDKNNSRLTKTCNYMGKGVRGCSQQSEALPENRVPPSPTGADSTIIPASPPNQNHLSSIISSDAAVRSAQLKIHKKHNRCSYSTYSTVPHRLTAAWTFPVSSHSPNTFISAWLAILSSVQTYVCRFIISA